MSARQRPVEQRLVGYCLALALPWAASSAVADSDPVRPTIKANRWQEDWSVLADPALRNRPLDSFKYMPFSDSNPQSYASVGLTLRERFETNGANAFGTKAERDSYLLQRFLIHADIHFNENWRLFTQLEDSRAFDKTTLSGADQNRVDLRLAFLEYTKKIGENTLKARVGRQDFAFDLQRFISSRDGPNVRQSFDAVWADWETGDWRFIGLASRPVQYQDEHNFDDRSNDSVRFNMLRVEKQVFGSNELSAYYAEYDRDEASYLDGSGSENRKVFDARLGGAAQGFDWDIEGMAQRGSVGTKNIRAWAGGSRTGYTFNDVMWKPRIGMQLDAASGDSHPGDNTVGTFNPLFPNGYYFSLAGYTGYTNLFHVKPSVTIKPINKLSIQTAIGLLWRQTTNDAVYVQPNLPVAGTAGQGNRWTGAYGQIRTDYAFTDNLSGAIEAVHYDVGQTIRDAGGHDSNYLGVELKLGW